MASTLLRIRPIIHVDKSDGKYSGAGRTRAVSNIPSAIVDHLLKTYSPDTPLWATVQHGQRPELAAAMEAQLRSRLNIARWIHCASRRRWVCTPAPASLA